MRKREIPLTEEEKRERNKIYTTRYRKSHKEKVSQMVSDYQKRVRQERKEYKERIDKAIKYIEENRYTNNEMDLVDIMNYEDFDIVLVEDLLEILKGEK